MSVLDRLGRLIARFQATFVGRVWGRYNDARGNVLAGGIAYFAFFSVFPAVALGVTVLGLVLGDNSALQADLVSYVNQTLASPKHPIIALSAQCDSCIVTVDQLVQPSTLTTSAVIGLVTLVVTGLGWLDAMRSGIRAVFGRPPGMGNVVLVKLRDLGTLATLGFAVLVSSVAGAALSTVSHAVLVWMGLDGVAGAGTLVRGLTIAALLVLDTGTFLLLFAVLSDVDVPLRRLWQGAFAGAVGLMLLRAASAFLFDRVSQNRFLATFAVLVGLLVVMNLVGRITLLAASWSATRAAEAGYVPLRIAGVVADGAAGGSPDDEPADSRTDGGRRDAAGAATGSARAARVPAVVRTPSYGVRAADRTTLAAGVVLGLAGAWTAKVVRGAVRAVADAVRD